MENQSDAEDVEENTGKNIEMINKKLTKILHAFLLIYIIFAENIRLKHSFNAQS